MSKLFTYAVQDQDGETILSGLMQADSLPRARRVLRADFEKWLGEPVVVGGDDYLVRIRAVLRFDSTGFAKLGMTRYFALSTEEDA